MKRFQVLILCAALLLQSPAWAQQAPSFSISNAWAVAGSPAVQFTITETGSSLLPSKLTFATGSSSARSGVDYRFTIVALTFQPGGPTSETVNVPLLGTKPASPISFTATIRSVANATIGTAMATGTITPAPVVVVPPPTPAACPTLTDPNWTSASGSIAMSSTICTATKSCPSVWQNANANAAGITFPALVAGQQYYVSPMVGGLTPDDYTGTAVVASPTSASMSNTGDNEFDVSCFGGTTTVGGAAYAKAPLQDGSFAQVTNASDTEWSMTGPGPGRPLMTGEIVAIYFNGGGYTGDNQVTYSIYALSDGSSGRALAGDLRGVAPVGTPPGLPANWWVPGLVVANKTCANAVSSNGPGVTEGGVYRAALVAGSHMKLATGVTGDPSNMWQTYASGDLGYSAAHGVVTGDCLTGQ